MIELKKSAVVFDETRHTYTLDGKELSGITSLIHQVLGLGTYPDASEFVKQVAIPRAGYYGTSVHHAIQYYDTLGIKVVDCEAVEHPTRDFGVQIFGPVNVAAELEAYIEHQQGYRPIANEFTVSDNKKFASQIDNVWQSDEDGGIWLFDTKTNNTDYYPGGVEALKLYLSWQLSIYAYLFERQCGVKIAGLGANWFHKGQHAMWIIDRVPDEKVARLLTSEIAPRPDGHGFVYYYDGDASELLGGPLVEHPQEQIVGSDVVDAIADYLVAEKRAKTLKAQLCEAMKAHGITKWEAGRFTATIGKGSVSSTFDTKRFQKEQPEMYEQYIKLTNRAPSFRITLKNEEK